MSVNYNNEVLTLRAATADDLDHVADIAWAAFPADPQWDYRFPHRKEYPEDNWRWTRLMYENLMGDGNAVNVITVPIKKEDGGEVVHRPIAVAVWELIGGGVDIASATGSYFSSVRMEFPPFPSQCIFSEAQIAAGCEGRRDADPKRMEAFTDTISKAKKKWFDNVYGSDKLHLRILGTHPDYQRRGAGTKHCEWGMDLAKEHKVPVTLFSSPQGQKLYSHIGFDLLATITVQVEGEEEKLSIGVMIYKKS